MKNNYFEKPPLIKLLIKLFNNFPNERMSYVFNVEIDLGWFSVSFVIRKFRQYSLKITLI